MYKKITAVLAAAAALLGAQISANADSGYGFGKSDWPLAVTERPILIPQGMLEIRGDTARFNMSKDNVGDPIQLAPDYYYGISKTLNIGIVHADKGICISGDACAKTYNDVGVEALYGFMQGGSMQLALRGGVRIPSFDSLVAGLNVGLAAQLSAGKIRVNFDPRVYVGVVGRTADDPMDASMKEQLDAPLVVWYQIESQTALFVRTGLRGPLDGFGDTFQVPVGVGATFAVNNRLDFGAEWLFANAAGKNSSADERWLMGRVALRL